MPNMERLTTALAGCLAFVALHAQPVSESAPDPAFVRKRVRNKEIGLRYGVQIGVGSGAPGQAMQYAAMDFAAYNYRNIGLRYGAQPLYLAPARRTVRLCSVAVLLALGRAAHADLIARRLLLQRDLVSGP